VEFDGKTVAEVRSVINDVRGIIRGGKPHHASVRALMQHERPPPTADGSKTAAWAETCFPAQSNP
jgi:hypothetical protein